MSRDVGLKHMREQRWTSLPLEPVGDGSEDLLLKIPDEVIAAARWHVGDELRFLFRDGKCVLFRVPHKRPLKIHKGGSLHVPDLLRRKRRRSEVTEAVSTVLTAELHTAVSQAQKSLQGGLAEADAVLAELRTERIDAPEATLEQHGKSEC